MENSPPLKPEELRQIAAAYRRLRERLVRLAAATQSSEESVASLHRLGAQAGRLLKQAIEAGLGPPFDQWAVGPVCQPEHPLGPPNETNESLWWLYWDSFCTGIAVAAQPRAPSNFGRRIWTLEKQDAASGISMFTVSQPVSDPPQIWRDRIEDHAELCGLMTEELEERVTLAVAAAEEAHERDRRVLHEALDALEELLDDNRVRREFCRGVEEAVEARERWVNEETLPQLREAAELSELVSEQSEIPEPEGPAGAPGLPPGGAPPAPAPPDSLLMAMLGRGPKRSRTPEEVARDEAFDRYSKARREHLEHYDRWAKENAAEAPLCCAFLWRWHRRTRPAFTLLPELSRDYAAAFNPDGLPVALAPELLASVRKELGQHIARRRTLAAEAKADGWTKQELCTQAEIGETTFDRIAEKAGVARADSGQHGYRYGEDELQRLIAACAAPGKRKWSAAGQRWGAYLDAARKSE